MDKIQYEYVDVYFNSDEQHLADKEYKRLTKLGFEREAQDAGNGEHEFCDQYLRYKTKNRTKKN